MSKARQIVLNQVMRFADPADMDVGNWDICTDNILSALRSAGLVVVPVEPTDSMYYAFMAAWEAVGGTWDIAMQAAIAASQASPQGEHTEDKG